MLYIKIIIYSIFTLQYNILNNKDISKRYLNITTEKSREKWNDSPTPQSPISTLSYNCCHTSKNVCLVLLFLNEQAEKQRYRCGSNQANGCRSGGGETSASTGHSSVEHCANTNSVRIGTKQGNKGYNFAAVIQPETDNAAMFEQFMPPRIEGFPEG